MDCKTARLLLHYSRPGDTELEEYEAEELEAHLADCSDCGAAAQWERQADNRISRAMLAVPVPDDLRERLLTRLARERRTVYRRWAVGGVASAAAAAVIGWLALHWHLHHLPRVDPEVVLTRAMEQAYTSPDKVEAHFAALGVDTVVPATLNLDYLSHFGLTDFEGRMVPQLVLVRNRETALATPRDGAVARVYILDARKFDMDTLKDLSRRPATDSGGFTIRVLWYPQQPRFAYLVVYSGGPQPWFLKDAAQMPT
ncbi:MAG: hypothetical protein ACK4RK_20825 [Gemmataceae bacterium]